MNPINDQQLNEIEACVTGPLGTATVFDHATVAPLVAEIRRLRAAMEEIRHLHCDSPMGPCPVCIDADAVAAGGDGLMPYPCPTGRLAGAQDCDPPHVRAARYEAAGNAMAASLVRDGFDDDEITEILARRAATPAVETGA